MSNMKTIDDLRIEASSIGDWEFDFDYDEDEFVQFWFRNQELDLMEAIGEFITANGGDVRAYDGVWDYERV
jgi:hypothetical protein